MGFSLGEIFVLILVGIIVVGPRNLPGLMRTAGMWIGRLRRMSSELRSQSGIDDLIRQEGLEDHLRELRSFSRMNVVESLIAPAAVTAASAPAVNLQPYGEASVGAGAAAAMAPYASPTPYSPPNPARDHEYPVWGCDNYGATTEAEPPVTVRVDPPSMLEMAHEAPPAGDPPAGDTKAAEPAPIEAVQADERPHA